MDAPIPFAGCFSTESDPTLPLVFAGLPSDPGVIHDVLFQLHRARLVRRGLRGWRLTVVLRGTREPGCRLTWPSTK